MRAYFIEGTNGYGARIQTLVFPGRFMIRKTGPGETLSYACYEFIRDINQVDDKMGLVSAKLMGEPNGLIKVTTMQIPRQAFSSVDRLEQGGDYWPRVPGFEWFNKVNQWKYSDKSRGPGGMSRERLWESNRWTE